MKSIRSLLPLAALLLLFSVPGESGATVTGPNPCAGQPSYSWYGDSVSVAQDIPSTTVAGLTFPSSILRPADTAAFPGKRPVVVLQHGRGGNRCSLWWAAQFLSGHGYVVEIHAAPPDSNQVVAFNNAVDATRAAFAFMRSPQNPAAAFSDTERVGLAGHSLGSAVTSLLQGDQTLGIDAVIASDNLRRYMEGDPGGSNSECSSPPNVEVNPLVPALGFAKDEPCNSTPGVTDPLIKQFGWSWWRERGLPTVELVMRGFGHGDFAGGGEEAKKRDLAHWYEAWFDHWLLDEPADRILATEVNGRPTAEVLSGHYLSAACLPGLADTTDLSSWLAAGSPKPERGACDPAEEPDPVPDPDPVPQAEPKLSLKAFGARRIRPGGRAVIKVRVRNAGSAAATGPKVRVSFPRRKARAPRLVRVGRLAPGRARTVKIRIRARRAAAGRIKFTVRLNGRRAVRTLRVVR